MPCGVISWLTGGKRNRSNQWPLNGASRILRLSVEILSSLRTYVFKQVQRSSKVPNERSTRPLACGELAQMISMFSSLRARPNCVIPPVAFGLRRTTDMPGR